MGKISPEEKIEWVEKIIRNKESVYSVASKIGVHPSSIDTWVRNYKSIGTEVFFATVYKGNIIKNLIMDCQSYTKYRPNETTGGIFVSWRRKEELPTGA